MHQCLAKVNIALCTTLFKRIRVHLMIKIMKIQMVLNAVHRTLTTELPNASTQGALCFWMNGKSMSTHGSLHNFECYLAHHSCQ